MAKQKPTGEAGADNAPTDDAAAENTPTVEALTAENNRLKVELEKIKKLTGRAEVPPHVPVWKRHQVRATGRGFVNNRVYDAGEEFTMTIDAGVNEATGRPIAPPSWVELLDEGTPVGENANGVPNGIDFAKAEPPKTQTGFAAGVV
jgi:hypothetical protein